MRKKLTQKIKLDGDFCHEKIYRGTLSSDKNDEPKFEKEGKIYRGSSAVVEGKSTLAEKATWFMRSI